MPSRMTSFALTQQPETLPLLNLVEYLQENKVEPQLVSVLCAVATACVEISKGLAQLPLTAASTQLHAHTETTTTLSDDGTTINVQGEEQKPMDVVSNNILKRCLLMHVAAMASEEEETILWGRHQPNKNHKSYEISFDPLDGSSNLDVVAPTGTIFGIAPFTCKEDAFTTSGRSLVAAGYAVYSSATELVISLGNSTRASSMSAACFTLDPTTRFSDLSDQICLAEHFRLTRPDMQCPAQGSFYSLNEAREPDWPQGLRHWVHDAKRGRTPSGTTYSSRYICSLCADIHSTLLRGGWCGNPRPHLRLLYEAAPLSHVTQACSGRGSNGEVNLLDIVPTSLHERTSVFLGSIQDIQELESYGNIQQASKTYKQ